MNENERRTPKPQASDDEGVAVLDRIDARYVDDVGFLLCNLHATSTGIEGAILSFSHGEYSRTEVEHGPKLLGALGDKPSRRSFADAQDANVV